MTPVEFLQIVQVVTIGEKVIREGEWISLNGSTGEVILGKQALSPPAMIGDLDTFMSWADEIRSLKVRPPPLSDGTSQHPAWRVLSEIIAVNPRSWQMQIHRRMR